jgi:hypothetical protein
MPSSPQADELLGRCIRRSPEGSFTLQPPRSTQCTETNYRALIPGPTRGSEGVRIERTEEREGRERRSVTFRRKASEDSEPRPQEYEDGNLDSRW